MTSKNSNRNELRLEQITISIVNELQEVGIYHYNKLTYLFEYLFIKNFGMKYIGELFIKLPHGPVIDGYKNLITNQFNKELLFCEVDVLQTKRKLDDDYDFKIPILKTDNGENVKIEQSIVREFLLRVLDKYAHLTVDELEEQIYNTTPVKNYLNQVGKHFKREKGGYILQCITLRQFSNPHTEGRKKALKHFLNSRPATGDQLKKYQSEFKYLEFMRP